MRLERSVRYGIVGTVGVSVIALGTLWVIRQVAMADGAIGTIRVGIAVVIGTLVALMFLFALVDALVDEKLDTHGPATNEE